MPVKTTVGHRPHYALGVYRTLRPFASTFSGSVPSWGAPMYSSTASRRNGWFPSDPAWRDPDDDNGVLDPDEHVDSRVAAELPCSPRPLTVFMHRKYSQLRKN